MNVSIFGSFGPRLKQLVLPAVIAVLAPLFCSCSKTSAPGPSGPCRIHGTISSQYNDRRIFLVPFSGPQTAEYVDSIEIKAGRFEFTTDTVMMAKILVDYHYRMGVQPLLVVTEPGDVNVVIDAESSATGTPLNDSLQQWKQVTEAHHAELAQLRREGNQSKADSLHLAYKQLTRRLAAHVEGTVLGEFLSGLYPYTYKRKMSDGRIATFNADTNEEIPE